MLRIPKAILFDLDETILSFGGRELLLVQVAEEFASDLAPLSPIEVGAAAEAAFVEFWATPGMYTRMRNDLLEARTILIEGLFASWPDRPLGATPETARRFAERFHALREGGEGRLFPGAIHTIEELRARGILLALVTNGHADTQRMKVERYGLTPLFDHIQIEGEVGFGKPEEQAYRHAMNSLGVSADETWMVGDNLEWEVEAPQRLGIFAVWHDHSGKGLPEGSKVVPDLIVSRIRELLDLLPPGPNRNIP